MFMRTLISMDTEETIAEMPVDAVVLIGGCDKTVPAQLMGAASANKPAIQPVAGSMLTDPHPREGGRCVHRLPIRLGTLSKSKKSISELCEFRVAGFFDELS